MLIVAEITLSQMSCNTECVDLQPLGLQYQRFKETLSHWQWKKTSKLIILIILILLSSLFTIVVNSIDSLIQLNLLTLLTPFVSIIVHHYYSDSRLLHILFALTFCIFWFTCCIVTIK